jgi:drug/metabolite transporter (DMT)-like permease
VSAVDSATGQLTASSILLVPMALVVDRPWTVVQPGISVWLAITALALVSTALAYLLFYRILGASGATGIMLVTFLIPVSAILLGVSFLGEVLEPGQVAGMIMIGLGLAAIDGRPFRALGRRYRR